jgi:hypothetical protein
MTPRTIVCPNCRALVDEVCLQYDEPDVPSDLARRVSLYCAERIDAVFSQLAAAKQTRSTKSSRQIDAELAEIVDMLKSGCAPEEIAKIAKQRRLGQP